MECWENAPDWKANMCLPLNLVFHRIERETEFQISRFIFGEFQRLNHLIILIIQPGQQLK